MLSKSLIGQIHDNKIKVGRCLILKIEVWKQNATSLKFVLKPVRSTYILVNNYRDATLLYRLGISKLKLIGNLNILKVSFYKDSKK